MARPNFTDTLRLPDTRGRSANGGTPGPPAEGPIDSGDVITWIQVWIFQNPRRGRTAAAAGESGWDDEFKRKWHVDTEMVQGSGTFEEGKPAQAMALALIKRGGRTKEFYWWSEPIMLLPPG